MKKRYHRKSPAKRKSYSLKKSFTSIPIYLRYVVIGLVIILVVVGLHQLKNLKGVYVLGNATGPMLADHGSDDSGSGGGTGGNDSTNTSTTQTAPIQIITMRPTEKPEMQQNNQQRPAIEIESQENNAVVTSHDTEKELDETTSELEKMNEELGDDGVEVGTTATNGFTIKKGEVEAGTHFPLSVNPTTHVLTVTTPAGVKEVTILPDEAVQNALQTRLIDSVENQASGSGETQNVTLTQLNNQPVFQINGLINKKLLGIFSVSLAKTAFVSAETGNVVKVDESLLNSIFERLSF